MDPTGAARPLSQTHPYFSQNPGFGAWGSAAWALSLEPDPVVKRKAQLKQELHTLNLTGDNRPYISAQTF